MKYIKRAWGDTFTLFGGWMLLLPLALIFPVGFALHLLKDGWASAVPELETFITYGLQATGLVFGTVFLLNLACAPYRMERDAHAESKKLLEGMPDNREAFNSILQRRNTFTLREAAALLVDGKLSGDLSHVAQAQLSELQAMMADGKIIRHDERSSMERLYNAQQQLNVAINGTKSLPLPKARMTKGDLVKLSKELKLPITGLES